MPDPLPKPPRRPPAEPIIIKGPSRPPGGPEIDRSPGQEEEPEIKVPPEIIPERPPLPGPGNRQPSTAVTELSEEEKILRDGLSHILRLAPLAPDMSRRCWPAGLIRRSCWSSWSGRCPRVGKNNVARLKPCQGG
jgi:hypothetical protein